MSEWITDRLPRYEETLNGCVLAWIEEHLPTLCVIQHDTFKKGTPWQPIKRPAPYVKPKRWTVQFNHGPESFILLSHGTQPQIIPWLNENHAEAAQRICEIYNEVYP